MKQRQKHHPKAGALGRGRVPLERALSKLGIASRKQARNWILEGKVSVAGKTVRDPLRPVNPETAKITISGGTALRAETTTILLHKTKGLVTTRSDEKGRPTIYSLLEDIPTHLVPVGRLDQATTGLLLLTNDTQLANWLTDPLNKVPRTYIVTVRGELTPEKLKRLLIGVKAENAAGEAELLRASWATILKASRRETHLRLQLMEGKNREIRRMLSSLGHEVTRLKRVSFGGLELGNLELGNWRSVTPEELLKAFPGARLRKL